MAKVSIGLRGWRFEESALFTDDGDWRDLSAMPEDARDRLARLPQLVEEPCDACYLDDDERESQAAIVYGEPLAEVLLCVDHEADFLYWFREAGGEAHAGDPDFADAFHEWFADGGRAPTGYGGMDHVATEPAELPDLPSAEAVQRQLYAEADFEPERYDLREYVDDEAAPPEPDPEAGSYLSGDGETGGGDDEDDGDLDVNVDDIDLDTDYPSR
ncbi:MAG: hypothetical protein ABEJ79_06275 [Halolamina sp.]